MIPLSFVVPDSIQNVAFQRPLSVLFDSGSTTSWFNRASLPPGVHGTTVDPITGSTMAGTFKSNQQLQLKNVVLPEFRRNQFLPDLACRIFEADCRYDMILGRDALRAFGLHLDFDRHEMTCNEVTIPMREFPNHLKSTSSSLADQLLLDDMDSYLFEDPGTAPNNDDIFAPAPLSDNDAVPDLQFNDDDSDSEDEDDDDNDVYPAAILPSLYDKADMREVCRKCTHLTQEQQDQLYQVLSKYETLFDGKLKKFNGDQIHLDINPEVPSVRTRAYPVPHAHMKVFKDELDRLVEIGVLEKGHCAEWISPTFIIPKKDGRVRWISDFRALNKAIKRKVYPIPRIQDIITRRPGYEFLTKIDISMQYYTFDMDEASRELCTIATPFGLYRYARLPMGVTVSPDIAQEIMENLLEAIKDIEVYIDDIACFSQTFEHHLELLDKVLSRLQDAGFTVNPLKCEWAVKETDFLGHWLTPTGVKPWQKKVDAILKLSRPTNIKELRSCLGLVTYYRDMWPRRSHILAPLTDLLRLKKGSKIPWNSEHEKAFEQMKAMVAADALLAYPDHNKPFHIETDASDYQLAPLSNKMIAPSHTTPASSTTPRRTTLQLKKSSSALSKPSANSVPCFSAPRSTFIRIIATLPTSSPSLLLNEFSVGASSLKNMTLHSSIFPAPKMSSQTLSLAYQPAPLIFL